MSEQAKIVTILVQNELRTKIEAYFDTNLRDKNPYTASPKEAEEAAQDIYSIISCSNVTRNDANPNAISLKQAIIMANNINNVPPIHIRNFIREPAHSAVEPKPTRGYNYGGCEQDRMKVYFYTEWSAWITAILLNHRNIMHPTEHGGGNRFHLVSPISVEDNALRNAGASTGGGKFDYHSDSTVYNEFRSTADVTAQLVRLGATTSTVEQALERPFKQVLGEILCGKYTRVDATMLAGIYNTGTLTYLVLPQELQRHLSSAGHSQDDLRRLASCAVAHFAGPADGDISGFVGTIAPPIELDDNGDIFSTCLNLAPGRMKYVGSSHQDGQLFERFVNDARTAPVEGVLVRPGDILLFPNRSFGTQLNVLHGRGKLQDDDYRIEVEPGIFVRRAHCRQYLQNRRYGNEPSFLQSMGGHQIVDPVRRGQKG